MEVMGIVRKNYQTLLDIGGIRISLESSDQFFLETSYRHFRKKFRGKPDICIRCHKTRIPKKILDLWDSKSEYLFDSGQTWTLKEVDDKMLLKVSLEWSRSLDSSRMVVADKTFKEIDIYGDPKGPDASVKYAKNWYPFSWPVDQLIFVNHIFRKKCVLLHALGTSITQKGVVFCGESGDGKTTLSHLVDKDLLLNDDRIICRKQGNNFFMHSTPWHGTNDTCSSGSFVLNTILFIHHSKSRKNRFQKVSPSAAVQRLMQRSFLTYWDPIGFDESLSLFSELVANVPCYDLYFTPDRKCFDLVGKIVKGR